MLEFQRRYAESKMLAVHCMPDHIHIFVGFDPSVLISNFVKEIKVESNEFINGKKWIKGKFSWQLSYSVFSYSRSQIGNVITYINNQENIIRGNRSNTSIS